MRREDLKELHYIAAIPNVRSILIRGIYCYRRAGVVAHDSFADVEVQGRREAKKVPGGLWLHDYVNLYICAQNATLYKIHERHENICILRVRTAVLDIPGVVVADRNAAADARFGHGPEGLNLVDRQLVFATTWKHTGDSDHDKYYRQAKAAEVLVPDRVSGSHIFGAYVSCEQAAAYLHDLVPELEAVIHPDLFFLHGR